MKTMKATYQSPRCEVVILSAYADVLQDGIGFVRHSGGDGGFGEGDIV
ncbi:MAG: hypothetical protein J6P74_08065 [Paludibacteraceae bacterium]|nr:hypothetical protein [Paludibacteraceae bacterium]